MAEEPRDTEDEVLDETQDTETAEDQQHEEADEQQSEEQEQSGEDEGDEEETIIGFGDEEEEASEDDTPTIRRIRERNKDLNKQLRDKDRELAELRQQGVKPVELGPKPTLESCEWDEEKFETALDEWKAKKADADAQAEKAGEQTRRIMDSYNRDLETYNARKASIGVPDYEEAESAVVAALSLEQQTVALQAANDPAALVVALGRSPDRLAELAKIDNPWKLAAAIARMEGAVKVVKRKKAPALDRSQRGSASVVAPNADAELERLEKEADRTGVRTALIAYKRKMKAN